MEFVIVRPVISETVAKFMFIREWIDPLKSERVIEFIDRVDVVKMRSWPDLSPVMLESEIIKEEDSI